MAPPPVFTCTLPVPLPLADCINKREGDARMQLHHEEFNIPFLASAPPIIKNSIGESEAKRARS